MMWHCELCGDRERIEDILEHLRLMHPDIADEQYGADITIERWPDGGVVVYEDLT